MTQEQKDRAAFVEAIDRATRVELFRSYMWSPPSTRMQQWKANVSEDAMRQRLEGK